jgi:Cu+-exporting ATPase
MKTIEQHGTALHCAHCGDDCGSKPLTVGTVHFCCEGCKTVYQLLNEHGLCSYYSDNSAQGNSLKQLAGKSLSRFAYLDDPSVYQALIEFRNGDLAQVSFTLPSMHCTSCLWLLEKLGQLRAGIVRSEVQLPGKQITIIFHPSQISIRSLVELLTLLGYEPDLPLASLNKRKLDHSTRSLYLQLGIAGFAFGNIMLFSLPAYFDDGTGALEQHFHMLFGGLNIVFALPVLLYSALPFFRNAWTGLSQRTMNLDIPIAMGILALFTRSAWEILSGTGLGFMDSFAGLVFFLLTGRLFQKKSFDTLAFDRDYASYLPLQCIRIDQNGTESSIAASALQPGDILRLRNREIIPADSVMESDAGHIDYSFITGESTPVEIVKGQTVYAGAKVLGPAVQVKIMREISRSALLRLWNSQSFRKPLRNKLIEISGRFGTYFTSFTISLAVIAALCWLPDISAAVNVFTAVLIIACPCALTLAAPFALGNIMRIAAKHVLFFKNPDTVLEMALATDIVFDKTGTLTSSLGGRVEYQGISLDTDELRALRTACLLSTHPRSRALAAWLADKSDASTDTPYDSCASFQEIPGAGWQATFLDMTLCLGSASFITIPPGAEKNNTESTVYVRINGEYKGFFIIQDGMRSGMAHMIGRLRVMNKLNTFMLSGDHDHAAAEYMDVFGNAAALRFQQSPEDKAAFIQSLQQDSKRHVIMAGDGLNDTVALRQSNTGIAITEHISSFTPGCDAIMSADSLMKLPEFIEFVKSARKTVIGAFWISVLYNAIGLGLAVSGQLSPVITAILMPVSSLTVIGYTLGKTSWHGSRLPGTVQQQNAFMEYLKGLVRWK